MSQKVMTESTKIYPRGRGKVLVISEKTVMKKPKKGKGVKSLTLFAIKSNPEPIILRMYVNKGIKRFVLFPEGRILQAEERQELASALLASLSQNLHTKYRNPHTVSLTVNQKREATRGVYRQIRDLSIEKYDRINRFIRRNQE